MARSIEGEKRKKTTLMRVLVIDIDNLIDAEVRLLKEFLKKDCDYVYWEQNMRVAI